MLTSSSVDLFLEDPIGRVVEAPSFSVWCADPTLCGACYRGRPGAADLPLLFRALAIEDHPRMAESFDVLTDARRVEGVEEIPYRRLLNFVRARVPAYARRLRRNAIVRPEGTIGGMIAGVYSLVEPRHDWRVFARLEHAVAWLGRPEALTIAEQVAGYAAGQGARPLAELRALLARCGPGALTVARAAAQLGMSTRTLQRSLERFGTSFRAEMERVR